MSSDDDPLKKVFSLLSEKMNSAVKQNEEKEKEKTKHLNGFVDTLGSAIKEANELKDDDLYQLKLKEEKVDNTFFESIKTLVNNDYEKIQKERQEKESKPLNDFITTLSKTMNGEVIEEVQKPEEPEVEIIDEKVEEVVEELDVELIDEEVEEEDRAEDTVDSYLDFLDNDSGDEEAGEDLGKIKDYIEDLFNRFKTQVSTAIGYGGGGGTNAVNYAAGGVINGDLNINGQILSGGEDLDSIFVNESGDTMTGDLNILANLSAQEIEVNQAYTLPTTSPENTEVIVNENGTLIWSQPEKLHLQVRNDEGEEIPIGTPVYAKDEIGGSNRIHVGIAKASDPTTLPAIGITETTLNTTDTKDGYAITSGVFNGNITGDYLSGLDEGHVLYVAAAGGLTNTKPTGPTNLIQNIGKVIKAGGGGSIILGMKVSSIDRTNDVPNLSAGHIFYGEGDYYTQVPLISAVREGLVTESLTAAELHSTGPILSAGVNIDTLFGSGGGGSGDLTKANADTYYVNISGDTMTGQLNVPTVSAQSLSADNLTLANESLRFEGGGSIEGDDNGNILIRNNTLSVSALSAAEFTTTGPILSAGVNIDTLFGSGGGSGDLTKADADTYYVNISGDTMTGSLSTINLSATEIRTTGQILSAGSDILTLMPTSASQLTNDSGFITGLVQATEAQILDSTQHSTIGFNAGQLALATDSSSFFANINSNINQHSHSFIQIDPTAIDIGIDSSADTKHATQDVNLIGLGEDYISDKLIFNCKISDNSLTEDGSIKFDSTENGLFIYKSGGYKQVLDSIRINSDERDQLEYLPDGKLIYIDVHTGDSDEKDINNNSVIQEYQINSGALQNKVVISGGTF